MEAIIACGRGGFPVRPGKGTAWRNWIVAALVAVLAVSAVASVAIAQEEPPDPAPDPEPVTANVEVRVWQDVNDARNIYISARPENGSWATLGTIPLPLDDGHSSSGRFRYGDISVGVPVGAATATVEVRVWQDVNDALSIYISARPENGSWATLGTIPLPLDDGFSSSGRYRYGDIVVAVTLGALPSPTPTPTPTPTPAPWVDPRPDNTYTLRELAAMPAPAAPQLPYKPDPLMTVKAHSSRVLGGNVGLIDDPRDNQRFSVHFSYEVRGRDYPIECGDVPYTFGNGFSCEWESQAPFSENGTERIDVNHVNHHDVELGSVYLDGESLACEERTISREERSRGSLRHMGLLCD